MGPGRRACRTDITNHIALANTFPRPDTTPIPGQVSIRGLVAICVPKTNIVSIAPIAARALNNTMAGGVDWRARWRSEVRSFVQARVTADRLAALESHVLVAVLIASTSVEESVKDLIANKAFDSLGELGRRVELPHLVRRHRNRIRSQNDPPDELLFENQRHRKRR